MSSLSAKMNAGLTFDNRAFKNLAFAMGSFQSTTVDWPQYLTKESLPNGTIPSGAAGDIYGTVNVPTDIVAGSTIVIAWTGTISSPSSTGGMKFQVRNYTVTVGSSFVAAGSSQSVGVYLQGTNGYVELQLNDNINTGGTFNIGYEVNSTFSNMSSIIVCRKADYNSIINATSAADMWRDEWVNALAALNLRCVRYLSINDNCLMTQFRYRQAWRSAVFNSSRGWLPTCFVAGGTSGGPTYSIGAAADTPGTYTHGEVIQTRIAAGASSSAPIATLGAFSGGSGYVNGTYSGVALTGGSGSGATANITVSGGSVTAVTLVAAGTAYIAGDTLSAANTSLGGSGASFVVQVNTTTVLLQINVGGRGNVPMLSLYGTPIGSVSTGLCTMIYDDLLGGYIYAPGGYGNDLGHVPLEYLIGLGNRIGVDVWYAVPVHSTYRDTDHGGNSIKQMAQLCDTTLIGNMIIEHGNEIWNTGAPYTVNTQFVNNCGLAFGFTLDNNRMLHGFHAYVTVQYKNAVQAVWTGSSHKGFVAYMSQCAGAAASQVSTYALQGSDMASVANGGQGNAKWISYTGNANYRTAPNQPGMLFDVIGYAPYFSGANFTNFDFHVIGSNWTLAKFNAVKVWADLFATGTAANIDAAFQGLDADIASYTSTMAAIYAAYEAAAAGFDAARIAAGMAKIGVFHYEGAFECSAISATTCGLLGVSTTYGDPGGLFDLLLTGYKNSDYFYRRCKAQYDQQLAAHTARDCMPCWFLISPQNQWSLFSGDITSAPYKSYYVVKNEGAARRRFYTS